jgi:hypothetical protein
LQKYTKKISEFDEQGEIGIEIKEIKAHRFDSYSLAEEQIKQIEEEDEIHQMKP